MFRNIVSLASSVNCVVLASSMHNMDYASAAEEVAKHYRTMREAEASHKTESAEHAARLKESTPKVHSVLTEALRTAKAPTYAPVGVVVPSPHGDIMVSSCHTRKRDGHYTLEDLRARMSEVTAAEFKTLMDAAAIVYGDTATPYDAVLWMLQAPFRQTHETSVHYMSEKAPNVMRVHTEDLPSRVKNDIHEKTYHHMRVKDIHDTAVAKGREHVKVCTEKFRSAAETHRDAICSALLKEETQKSAVHTKDDERRWNFSLVHDAPAPRPPPPASMKDRVTDPVLTSIIHGLVGDFMEKPVGAVDPEDVIDRIREGAEDSDFFLDRHIEVKACQRQQSNETGKRSHKEGPTFRITAAPGKRKKKD
jgi:hypothetical protein